MKKTSSKSIPKMSVEKDSNVSISKIENGYLISKSGYVGTGKNQRYESRQYYSPTDPVSGALSVGKTKFGGKK